MTPRSVLLSVLVLTTLFSNACGPLCNNKFCVFVGGFPVKLKKLQEDFPHITDYNDSQMFCFLHPDLCFYTERVFSNYASSQDQRCSSALTNAFQHQERYTSRLDYQLNKMDNCPRASDLEGLTSSQRSEGSR